MKKLYFFVDVRQKINDEKCIWSEKINWISSQIKCHHQCHLRLEINPSWSRNVVVGWTNANTQVGYKNPHDVGRNKSREFGSGWALLRNLWGPPSRVVDQLPNQMLQLDMLMQSKGTGRGPNCDQMELISYTSCDHGKDR